MSTRTVRSLRAVPELTAVRPQVVELVSRRAVQELTATRRAAVPIVSLTPYNTSA